MVVPCLDDLYTASKYLFVFVYFTVFIVSTSIEIWYANGPGQAEFFLSLGLDRKKAEYYLSIFF